jgi:hypothetical protein
VNEIIKRIRKNMWEIRLFHQVFGKIQLQVFDFLGHGAERLADE